jgi:Skp family chaperone for outer membrane proteins
MLEPYQGNEPESVAGETVPGQEQQTPTPAGYVTPDELSAFKKEVDEKLSNLYRGIQSQNDKLSYKVQQRIEAYERAAAAQGVVLTPSQKQQLTDQTTIEEVRAASQSAPSSPVPDPNQRKGETEDEFVKRVNEAAETLMKVSGITFADTDPEVELINKAAETGTAEQYLNAHKEAIRLKKERLASGGQAPTQRTPVGGAPGAIPGSPATNPIANTTDTDTLWEMAKQQGKVP